MPQIDPKVDRQKEEGEIFNESSQPEMVEDKMKDAQPDVIDEQPDAMENVAQKEDSSELQKIIEANRRQALAVEDPEDEIETVTEKEAGEKTEQTVDAKQEGKQREILEQFDLEKQKTSQTKKDDDKDDDEDDKKDEKMHVKKHAHEIHQMADPQQQIERIVQLAVSKDPFFAVKVARHLDDNYIMDQVHDRLVEDKVRDELKNRGLWPEE